MISNPNNEQFVSLLREKDSFAIALAANASYDGIAAAMALYFALSKMGKNVIVISDTGIPAECGIFGLEKIGRSLSVAGDVLEISFPYKEGAVDKVTYSDKDLSKGIFKIIITPCEGQPRLDPKQVTFNYAGGLPDIVITIEAPNIGAIGAIYTENAEFFEKPVIVNIDRRATNSSYGKVNIIETNKSSISEIMYNILSLLGLDLDGHISSNLHTGIMYATGNFTSYTMTSETMAIIQNLIQKGAQPNQQAANYLQRIMQLRAQQAQQKAMQQQMMGGGYPQAGGTYPMYQGQQVPMGGGGENAGGAFQSSANYQMPPSTPQAPMEGGMTQGSPVQPQFIQTPSVPPFPAQQQYQPFQQANDQSEHVIAQMGNQQMGSAGETQEEEPEVRDPNSILQQPTAEVQQFNPAGAENKESKGKAPSEWLKPKVFKGNKNVG